MTKRDRGRQSRLPEIAILCVSAIVVLAIGGLSAMSARSAAAAAAEQNRAEAVADLDRDLLSSLKDAETGQRGYLVTGQEQFLEPYNQSLLALPGLRNRLQLLAESAPDRRRVVEELDPLISAKLSEMNETVGLRRSNQAARALAIADAGSGKAIMDRIRAECAALDGMAEQQRRLFAARADLYSGRLQTVGTAGSALLFCFLIALALTIFRGLNRRDELYRVSYESERRLAITLSSIADGVICTDATARITYLNPVAEKLTGCLSQDCEGRPIAEIFRIVSEDTRETVPNPAERAIAGGAAVGLANHTMLIDRGGQEFFIDDSAAPIRSESGEIVGAVLIFRDISERRRTEHEIARSAQALRQSNEELQQFASTASHDLQSPLRSMRTLAQLLAKQFSDRLGPDGSEMVGHISAAAGRMARLVEDLLTLAQTTGVDFEPVGVAPVQDSLDAACGILSGEIQSTGATVDSSASLPVVAARPTHVTIVLQNMLGNSLKYRGADPPVIQVSAQRSNAHWMIGVKDNGIGIDPQYAGHIFQPFRRLHGSEYEGTGLGLWTCHRIVAGYGGRVWVESEPGQGATFFFTLPAVPGEPSDSICINDA